MFVILMGVSACGKTTLGMYLAKKLGWKFLDADDFHSNKNITKMSAGTPLNDDDRFPWLQTLHTEIKRCNERGVSVILACSALKEKYRNILLYGEEASESSPSFPTFKLTIIVHLKGDKDVIAKRLSAREGHFMPEELLNSQYIDLEEPDYSLPNVLELSIENIVEHNSQMVEQLISNVKTNQ